MEKTAIELLKEEVAQIEQIKKYRALNAPMRKKIREEGL